MTRCRVTGPPLGWTSRDVLANVNASQDVPEAGMANDRLRDALLRHGLTPVAAAEHLGVDPKTAERWITQDRVPYPRHRHALAALVRESEAYLWPDALSPARA